ncbi:acetyl-CoA synthetase-like protein [Trametes maxima]|nr:acetyl-CoA synthetase-like protein [Trametes maxima]
MAYRTHLTVLYNSTSLFSPSPAFKIPRLATGGIHVEEWITVSYRQFLQDVERSAKHWIRTLTRHQIAVRSVIGIWLSGMTYLDALHIYGIARAGYIPQLFSLKLPNPELIYELLGRADARALVFDPSFRSSVTGCPVPAEVAADIRTEDVEDVALPSLWVPTKGDDIVMIYHTSGSTSGSPKLVPCTAEWVDAAVSKAAHLTSPRSVDRPDVALWLGSMCHTPQPFMLAGYLQHGACTVQPTKLAFTPGDLKDMVDRCGLTHVNLYATFLTRHLHASRDDPTLLSALRQLDKIFYSGLPLAADDEAYAYEQDIPIRNLFGSTEVGAMLLSVGGRGADASYLEPIEGTSYEFFPITPPTSEVDCETGYEDAHQHLLELVVLSSSGDCPHPSLRASDGHFHTGDLFLEVTPGRYISRGRDDDWIKSENALRCDTKAIEDNVRATCGALVAECVVVGNGRPSPTLFVEPKSPSGDAEQLKREIMRRTRHFMARRYSQEQILSTNFIVVVEGGALPRTTTKGNIRRRAVEQEFKAELDRIYGN